MIPWSQNSVESLAAERKIQVLRDAVGEEEEADGGRGQLVTGVGVEDEKQKDETKL